MRGMLYSGECRQTFRGILLNIPGNVVKHLECPPIFRGKLPNTPGNAAKHYGESPQAFRVCLC